MKCFNRTYYYFLSEHAKNLFERVVMKIAIITFLVHLLLIGLYSWGWLSPSQAPESINTNPISAIYTPFSIILFYEIYLLIYYLPQSITHYIGKQYEIICLIMIRSVFEQLGKISSSVTQQEVGELVYYKILGVAILFFLIFLFYRLSLKTPKSKTVISPEHAKKRDRFIEIKKVMSLGLLIVFIGIFIYSFISILYGEPIYLDTLFRSIKYINKLFYSTFFSILILAEVLLLLFTIELTERFSKVIRNSAFIISTVLLKLSFSIEGVDNIVIVIIAISFSVLTFLGYVLYRRYILD